MTSRAAAPRRAKQGPTQGLAAARAPSRRVLARLIALIEKASGRAFDGDVDAWYEWLWSTGRAIHPDYAEFKALLYAPIDARFRLGRMGHHRRGLHAPGA